MSESHRVKQFQSSHNLPFGDAPPGPLDDMFGDGWRNFRIGTCLGQWRAIPEAYEILSILNTKPGNGHFDDVLEWFTQSCKRDGKCLRFREVGNPLFKAHLIGKRGFAAEGKTDVVLQLEGKT